MGIVNRKTFLWAIEGLKRFFVDFEALEIIAEEMNPAGSVTLKQHQRRLSSERFTFTQAASYFQLIPTIIAKKSARPHCI